MTPEEIKEEWVYEIEMFKNIGTIDNPNMKWITEKRIYRGKKQLTDFDLHDVPRLRKNAKLLSNPDNITPLQ